MPENPDTLVIILGGLQLRDEPGEVAALVRVGGVEVVENVVSVPIFIEHKAEGEQGTGGDIPEISVQRNQA